MQENEFDTFGRAPDAPREDPDVAMSRAREDFENTPDEVHERHEREARAYMESEMGREILSEKRSAIIVEDPEAVRRIEQAAAREAEKHAETAAKDAAQATPAEAPAAPTNSAPEANSSAASSGNAQDGNGSASAQPAEKPTDLESTLANIRLNGDRQRRLVISGDKAIEAAFYAKLAARKQVFYQGGVPIITISRAKAIKTLQETASEFAGASSAHALSVKLDREGGGVIDSLKAGISNSLPGFLSRRHDIDVVVVGSPEVMQAKLQEIGGFVTALERNGHIKEGSAPLKDGKLVVSGDAPVELNGTAQLYDVLRVVNTKVINYNSEREANQAELREFRDAQQRKDMEGAKAKATREAGAGGSERINEHAEKLAVKIDQAFKDPDLLHANNGKGQVAAEVLLRQARGLGDPAVRELQTLPDEARQKAIVELAAIVAKTDNKEFDQKGVKKEQQLSEKVDHREQPGTSTLREKVEAFLTMEAARDADFGAKAQVLLKDLVERKFLTPAQSEELAGRVSDAVTAAHGARPETATSQEATSQAAQQPADEKAASAPAEGSATAPADVASESVAPQAGKEGEASTVAGDTAANADAESKEAAAADASKPALADASAEKIAEVASEPGAVSTSTPEAAARAVEQPPQASQEVTPAVPDGAVKAEDGQAAARASQPPLELRDQIAALAAEGSTGLTDKKADALVTELDGLRSKPLTALDAGSGSEPTQTLLRAEVLLQEVASGRFGSELQARANDLTDALQKWTQQDGARLSKEGLERADVVAQLKTAEPSLAAAAQATPVAGAPGKEAAAQPASDTPKAPSAEQLAREQATQRLWETESAAAKLASFMANPPGSFINKDKTWNDDNVQRAAREVLRIDPDTVSQLSAAQRTKIAVYASWVADNARSEKLPGFSSAEGKAQAAQLVERAAALIGKMEEGSSIPADVKKTLDKADRMVSSKLELQKTAALSTEVARESNSRSSISPAAASALASDMVHAAFSKQEVRDAQVKYLLKNASNLTAQALEPLSAQDKAKTAVAMSHLAQQVRKGAMGDFSKLPSAVQKNVLATAQAADSLLESMGKDPVLRKELNEAFNEVNGKAPANSRDTVEQSTKATHKELDTRTQKAEELNAKQEGRGMDR